MSQEDQVEAGIALLTGITGIPEYLIHCPSLTLEQLVKVRILLRQPKKYLQIVDK